jgi:16S rRNA (adenine1518-N6/adenine1519-N6)-dimethyltransferase
LAPIGPKDTKLFFKCVKAAFAQRRKTVLNSVCATMKLDKNLLSQKLSESGISLTARAEALKLDELCVLSDIIYEITR